MARTATFKNVKHWRAPEGDHGSPKLLPANLVSFLLGRGLENQHPICDSVVLCVGCWFCDIFGTRKRWFYSSAPIRWHFETNELSSIQSRLSPSKFTHMQRSPAISCLIWRRLLTHSNVHSLLKIKLSVLFFSRLGRVLWKGVFTVKKYV